MVYIYRQVNSVLDLLQVFAGVPLKVHLIILKLALSEATLEKQ